MNHDSDKASFFFRSCVVIGLLIVGLVFTTVIGGEEPDSRCQYANDFIDNNGQTWSVTEIEATEVGCTEAIEVALERGKESVGLDNELLQPVYEAKGWNCNDNSVCTKGKSRVTFTLEYRSS